MSQQTENALTDIQRDVLDFIINFIDSEGYAPSVRDIAGAFGWAVNGAKCHIDALKSKGYIDWVENKARTMRVLKNE